MKTTIYLSGNRVLRSRHFSEPDPAKMAEAGLYGGAIVDMVYLGSIHTILEGDVPVAQTVWGEYPIRFSDKQRLKLPDVDFEEVRREIDARCKSG